MDTMEKTLQHRKMINSSPTNCTAGVVQYPAFVTTVVSSADPLDLNNLAVSVLQSRRYDEALHLLDAAWSVETLMEEAHQNIANCALFAAAPSLQFAMNSLASKVYENRQPAICSAPADISSTSVSVLDDLDLTASPSNYFSMYNRAFILKKEKVQALSLAERSHLVPAILLYNMGLVFIKMGLQAVDGSHYVRAFNLYRLALGIVEKNLNSSLHMSDFSLLQLALYNNIGFINSHFFEDKEAMVCAGRMLATFASMDCSQLLSKEEYVFYYMNLLFLLNRNPIFAPAA
jgi:tetratricopeptide (TPR) repeat protein